MTVTLAEPLEQARQLVESWITECRDRTLYEADEVTSRLLDLWALITRKNNDETDELSSSEGHPAPAGS